MLPPAHTLFASNRRLFSVGTVSDSRLTSPVYTGDSRAGDDRVYTLAHDRVG